MICGLDYEGKMKFKLTSIDGWEMEVVIDFNFPKVMDFIKEMVEFWSEWEERLENNAGDYVQTFLQQLGQKVYIMTFQNYLNLINAFKDEEGYCPMDGSYGITILKFDDPVIPDKEDFEIEPIQ